MSNSPMYAPNTAMGTLDIADKMAKLAHERGQPYMTLRQMVFMRMRLPDLAEPFDFMEVYEGVNEMIIFAVVNDKPITLSDEKTLFPTDQLITKLNLLRK